MSTGNQESTTAKVGRTDIPPYPEYSFPQEGWHRLEAYAAALEMSRKALLAALHKYNVPRLRIGDRTLIRAETLLDCLKADGTPDEKAGKARKRKG